MRASPFAARRAPPASTSRVGPLAGNSDPHLPRARNHATHQHRADADAPDAVSAGRPSREGIDADASTEAHHGGIVSPLCTTELGVLGGLEVVRGSPSARASCSPRDALRASASSTKDTPGIAGPTPDVVDLLWVQHLLRPLADPETPPRKQHQRR